VSEGLTDFWTLFNINASSFFRSFQRPRKPQKKRFANISFAIIQFLIQTIGCGGGGMTILANIFVLVIALIILFFPVILLALPFILYYRNKAKKATVKRSIMIEKDTALINEILSLQQEIDELRQADKNNECETCLIKRNYEKILRESSFCKG